MLSIISDTTYVQLLTLFVVHEKKQNCYVITIRYAILQGYKGVGYSPLYKIYIAIYKYIAIAMYVSSSGGGSYVLKVRGAMY